MKPSEHLERMPEKSWCQNSYHDQIFNTYCISGWISNEMIGKPQWLERALEELYEIEWIKACSISSQIVGMNDEAESFQEAKSKCLKYLRGLGL